MGLYINASEVAAAIGANRFKSREDVIQSVLERLNSSPNSETRRMSELPVSALIREAAPVDLAKLEQQEALVNSMAAGLKMSRKTVDLECAKRERDVTTAQELVVAKRANKAAVADHTHRSDAVVVKRAEVACAALASAIEALVEPTVSVESVDVQEAQITRRMVATVPIEQQAAVRQAVRTAVSTTRGIRGESAIINAHQQTIGSAISDRNERVQYIVVGGVRIGGKCDGIDRLNDTLIEAKHRRSRFLGVPKYEAIQCEVYMRMYKMKRCTLVEHFNGESRNHQMEQSDKRWEWINQGLQEFENAYSNCRAIV